MNTESNSIAWIKTRLVAVHGDELTALLEALADDSRAGARALANAARARAARVRQEDERLDRMMQMQRELHDRGILVVVGVDEVGRGALAGPVTAAAVVLSVDTRVEGLNDSKKLAPAARVRIAVRVQEQAIAWSIAHAQPEEIDAVGIAPATRLAWRRALESLGCEFDHVLVDGNDGKGLGSRVTTVIGGDARVACIAAASVIAKVARDTMMAESASTYPGYGFERNKGYGAADHLERLRTAGPCAIHRRSFAPCSELDRLF